MLRALHAHWAELTPRVQELVASPSCFHGLLQVHAEPQWEPVAVLVWEQSSLHPGGCERGLVYRVPPSWLSLLHLSPVPCSPMRRCVCPGVGVGVPVVSVAFRWC